MRSSRLFSSSLFRLKNFSTTSMSSTTTKLLTNKAPDIMRARLNPITGQMEWQVKDETYDFYQEIARSGYADMLHDHERNVLYHQALKNVISDLHQNGRTAHVLDIGTGTGLLSMMAAESGADRVTACEAFAPMASTAKKIMAANGCAEKIRLIEKRSTDMTEDDMASDGKANICVAEVFDTELIGEGALRTFAEAHEKLLQPNARVIPKSSIVYVQLVDSEWIRQWASARSIEIDTSGGNRLIVRAPEAYERCTGGGSVVHDLQMDQIPRESLTFLTDPVPILGIDFEDPKSLNFDGFDRKSTKAIADGIGRAVLMWWDLDMDGTGQLILSMRPNWDKEKTSQWRDHWMQAIYYLPEPVRVSKDQELTVIGNHDEHSLWFDVKNGPVASGPLKSTPQSECSCSLHTICSRGNLGFLNDESRYRVIASALEKVIPGKICLCLSDCSLLPILASKLGAKKIYAYQKTSQMHRRILMDYARANEIDENSGRLISISDFDQIQDGDKIECIFGDPFFFNSMLPWHNLRFWYETCELRKRGLLADGCQVFPKRAHLKAMALESKDLWKIRAPVRNVEGFDLRIFDAIVQKATELCDEPVEPQPLWEYPSIALSRPVRLATFDLTLEVPEKESITNARIDIECPGRLNTMAVWIDWQFGDDHQEDHESIVSTGLTSSSKLGDIPRWNRFSRQGVYFFPYPYYESKSTDERKAQLDVTTRFDSNSGDVHLKAEIGGEFRGFGDGGGSEK